MSPTVLILAAGPGIGAHCTLAFHAAGYNVTTASRRVRDSLIARNHLELYVDLSKPDTVPQLFQKTRDHFGHPDVVVYNGAARTLGAADDPLSTLSLETINHDTAVNITSALLAAREAVKGWDEGKSQSYPTFFYTGNKQNVMTDPKALTFGMAKTAAAKMMWDCHTAYSSKGYRLYFTDQRKADGTPARELMDPEARARLYVMLAMGTDKQPWYFTFVKGTGYVDFRDVDKAWDVDM